MKNYILTSDSSCDLNAGQIKEYDLKILPMNFITGNGEILEEGNLPLDEFYSRMKGGEVFKTSMLNEEMVYDFLLPLAKEGKDIIHISLSGGISGTANAAASAVEKLKKEFPKLKIACIDSKSASLGQGLLCHHAKKICEKESTFEKAVKLIEELKLKICHYFTVESLVYLSRGGRISKVSSMIGNMLNIKPILHVNNDGELKSLTKCAGRKKAIKLLVEKVSEKYIESENDVIFISHGNCLDEAKAFAEEIKKNIPTANFEFSSVGSTIGSHSGPGTLTVFFIGKER